MNRDLRTLFVVTLMFRSGLMAFPFLSAYLLLSGEHTPVEVGIIVGAFGFGALLADFSASVLLGRVSARAMMVSGLVLHAVVLAVVPSLQDSSAILHVAVVAWGFTYEIYTPAVYSRTVAVSTADERKVAFACNRLAVNLGMAIGPAIGGLVFAVEPVALFYINAVCVLVSAGYLLLNTRPEPAGAQATTTKATKKRWSSPTLRGETQFWTIFTLAVPIHLAYALPPVLVSVFVIQGMGLPSYWASLVFLVNAVIVVLFEVPLNNAMRSMSHSRSLLVAYAFAAAGFLGMGLAPSGAVVLGATVLWTIAEMIVFPSLLSYVSDLSDRSVIDRNVSLYSAGVNVGFFLAPPLSLMLTGWGGQAVPWLLAGGAVFVALMLMAAARSNRYTWHQDDDVPRPELVAAGD